MATPTSSVRTGLFISHAHEDRELAQALRRLLESALGLQPDDITCTSDVDYGLERGGDLRDQIHDRLERARALFLLATAHARRRDWVQYECAYSSAASERGEMHFFVLAPTKADLESVPEPYRARVAVTLSHGADVLAFVHQLRRSLGQPRGRTIADHVGPLLALERRCVELEMAASEQASRTSVQQLEARCRRVVRRQRTYAALATLVTAALALGAHTWRLRGVDAAHAEAMRQNEDRISAQLVAFEQARDEELRSFPFAGFVHDGLAKRLACSQVVARVPTADADAERKVEKACDGSGTFLFSGSELRADPRQPFGLTVFVNGRHYDLSIDRATARVAIPIQGSGG